jgi:hypothetical protein
MSVSDRNLKNVRFDVPIDDGHNATVMKSSFLPTIASNDFDKTCIDDEVKDHPIFCKQFKDTTKVDDNYMMQCIMEQIGKNPNCTYITDPCTKTRMTRFGKRYWQLLISLHEYSVVFLKKEREEYRKKFTKQ